MCDSSWGDPKKKKHLHRKTGKEGGKERGREEEEEEEEEQQQTKTNKQNNNNNNNNNNKKEKKKGHMRAQWRCTFISYQELYLSVSLHLSNVCFPVY